MKKWLAVRILSTVVALGAVGHSAAGTDPAPDLAAACPCETTAEGAAWTSHDAYVGCVAAELRALRAARAVRTRQVRAGMRAARLSSCGDPALTRCCVYATDDDERGRCRLLTADACDAVDDRMEDGEADDAGSGSCVPNPCAG